MSDKIKAADAINRLAQSYQAVIDAASMLKEIGSLEQAKDEAAKARAAADKEAESAKAEAKKAKDAIKVAKEQADKIAADAQDYADKLIAEGAARAKQVAEKCQADCNDMISKATVDASAAKAAAVAEYKQVQDDIARAKEVLAEILSKQDAAVASAEDAEKRLAAAMSKVKSLLG